MKTFYQAPAILRQATVQLGQSLLTGSVVTKDTKVETKGQELVTYDFSDTQFNQTWE